MLLYLCLIFGCMTIIFIFNYLFAMPIFNFQIFYIILGVVISTVSVIIIDAIFATLVRWGLPKHWFAVDKKFFVPTKKKCLFYERLGIKKWKDKVLELGGFSGFHKNKLGDVNNIEYVSRFIVEANYGIIVHVACIIFGFIVIFIFPLKYWLCFGFPVAVVNAFLNLLPLIILRYNLPKLHSLYQFNIRRQVKKKETSLVA